MKGNITKIKAKGKPKSKTEKQLEHLKKVRGIERNIAIESGEFHKWMPTSTVHTDKRKKKDKNASREFKRNKKKYL